MTAKENIEEKITLEIDLLTYELSQCSGFSISKTINYDLKDELGDGFLDINIIIKDEEKNLEIKLIFNVFGEMFCDLGSYDLEPVKLERTSDIWKYFYLQTRI